MGPKRVLSGLASARGHCPCGDAPPILFLKHQKENAPRPVEEKKCSGGSVRILADLLPPAGDGWPSRAAVRDGNAPPLGKPSARGSPGYMQHCFPLPLAFLRGTRKRQRGQAQRPCDDRHDDRRTEHAGQGQSDYAVRREPAEGRQGLPALTRKTPRQRGGPLHRSAAKKRFFLLDRPRPVLFLSRTKREWGVESIAGHRQIPPSNGTHRAHPCGEAAFPHRNRRNGQASPYISAGDAEWASRHRRPEYRRCWRSLAAMARMAASSPTAISSSRARVRAV